ncbi:MAG: CDP-diacylglycerol--glycerol-3-phosphate 3-phosphatidyltransferase [Mucispirillum sp.]|nr:CDP-diacylglycerol--glycerol-3-phosphate 3-phosphatidyltransferase [Mucispirillum sp.]
MKIEMNIANQVTIARIAAIPLFLAALYINSGWSNAAATIIFTIAGLSDFLDGYIARKYNMITDLGKILDPIADKILVAAAMIALVEIGRLDGWIAILMLARDFTVGALRDLSASKGVIIAAGIWGKLKTAFQMVSLGMIAFYDVWLGINWYIVGTVGIYAALFLSLYSGYVYFRDYFAQGE